ncbi:MAG: hypothetical protein WBA16_05100 [Nonlabens sp.]
MYKTLLLVMIAAMTAGMSFAQKVKLKDDKVFVNGNQILTYEKMSVLEYSFYSLDDEEEVILYQYHHNETRDYSGDDYFIINFLEQDVKVESTAFNNIVKGMGMNSRKDMEKLIKWLVKNKVLDEDGTIEPKRVERFHDKYHENIRKRTVRY